MSYKTKRESILEDIKRSKLELAILDALGDVEGMGYIYISTYSDTINITPEGKTAREVTINVLSALKAKGAKPEQATKKFDADTGKVTFAIPGPVPGWTITVSGGEPRCRIKEVVEEYEVPEKPAVAAHMATRKKFVIENPEECGAEVKE